MIQRKIFPKASGNYLKLELEVFGSDMRKNFLKIRVVKLN